MKPSGPRIEPGHEAGPPMLISANFARAASLALDELLSKTYGFG
jgi:hypothetical protein